MSFRFLPLLSFVLGALPVVASSAPETDTLRRSIDAQSAIETAAQATQQRIDALDATDSLRRYNDQMELQIASQANEQAALREQIEQLDVTSREIVPLLARMLETLEQFVALDAPFLRVERASRLDTLRDLMPRADVSIAEKYRRIAEAYQVEMEYGRTLEAYQAQLSDDDPRVVNLLRVGRIALMYQTLDGGESGYWDREQAAFVPDQRYHGAIREGLKVARKQAAPSLLRLPLQAAAGEVSP